MIGIWVEDQPDIFTEDYMPRKRTPDQSSSETQSQIATYTPEVPSEQQPEPDVGDDQLGLQPEPKAERATFR
jgi:hypothetical protein